jgi:hypothetical protein
VLGLLTPLVSIKAGRQAGPVGGRVALQTPVVASRFSAGALCVRHDHRRRSEVYIGTLVLVLNPSMSIRMTDGFHPTGGCSIPGNSPDVTADKTVFLFEDFNPFAPRNSDVMSDTVDVTSLEEASLRYATSAIQAGVNKKEDALAKGASEDEAYGQGAAQALGIIHSSGADREQLVARLMEYYGLLDFVLQELLTDEEYAELVEGGPVPEKE